MKKISGLYSAPRPHWVGNGFPVRSLFSYNTHGRQLSPFLLLDHAGPAEFSPSDTPASTRIAVSKRSPLSMTAKWRTATPPEPAAKSAPATCNG